MSITLFHYVHCPFCIRVRMVLGYLKIPYESNVLPYDDEKTPIALTGKKMLPALKHSKGTMNESLDIIKFVDKQSVFKTDEVMASGEFKELEQLLTALGEPIHSLAMPYFIWTPEFSDSSRAYFVAKKEVKRGPFKELVKNKKQFEAELEPLLEKIEKGLKPFYESSKLRLHDVLLAAHLWGLYIVPEFQFSSGLHRWLQEIRKICNFNYHEDYWR